MSYSFSSRIRPAGLFLFQNCYENHKSYRVGRTPWPGDQPVLRPLLTHDKTNRKKDIHIFLPRMGLKPRIVNFGAGEDTAYLRPHYYCDHLSGFSWLLWAHWCRKTDRKCNPILKRVYWFMMGFWEMPDHIQKIRRPSVYTNSLNWIFCTHLS
jgi:hypothetical protein